MNAVLSSLQHENDSLRTRVRSLENELNILIQERQKLNPTRSVSSSRMVQDRVTTKEQNHGVKASCVPLVDFCVQELSRLNELAKTMQRAVLPTVTRDLNSKILHDLKNRNNHRIDTVKMRSNSGEKEQHDLFYRSSGYSIVKQCIDELEDSLQVLEIVTRAKLDSISMVKQKLRSQITELQTEYNLLKGANRRECSNLQYKEQEFGMEKQRVRDQITQLQALYEAQKQQLNEELLAKVSEKNQIHTQYESLSEKHSELISFNDKLNNDFQALKSKYESSEAARLLLASELSEQKKLLKAAQEQLSILKLSQKFLTTTTNRSESIPQERFDLMVMVNQLMTENSQLKLEKSKQDLELKQMKTEVYSLRTSSAQAQNSTRQSDMSSVDEKITALTPNEIALVAEERISIDSLANKLLSTMYSFNNNNNNNTEE